ncbi:hypothetical protein CsatB_003075 [Cannabis sativa]
MFLVFPPKINQFIFLFYDFHFCSFDQKSIASFSSSLSLRNLCYLLIMEGWNSNLRYLRMEMDTTEFSLERSFDADFT